ncbi:hypothetical protein BDA96_08G073300 [Sorghum bicolor]|uniref:Uncharacterized protein n=2 Tax=Sorghum bicolor TaxID=4558 RepID=A0A1B6PBR8_SORBI|nr:hypothetical protein BDA96_08G073300 [Sorghum bicolor]KXG23199.1 hypothetical protein SORBI_3008G068500 [Sorghum bicolor]OQU78894.1 hypothetical protein SORBI_3008G068500 [Sorghum bicolor]
MANSATQSEQHAATILAAPLDTLLCVRLCPVKCVLRDTPLGGYDGSLDDDPDPGVVHFNALLDRAVGRDGQPPATVAALRADAVGAAGGGLQAWVMAVGSAQSKCSTICPAVPARAAAARQVAGVASSTAAWSATATSAFYPPRPSRL